MNHTHFASIIILLSILGITYTPTYVNHLFTQSEIELPFERFDGLDFNQEHIITPLNSTCQNATSIVSDTTINGTTTAASIEDFNLCSLDSAPTVWFTTIGQNRLIQITTTQNPNDYFRMMIYEGHCDSLSCLFSRTITPHNDLSFLGEQGKRYSIAVQRPNNQDEDDFSFNIKTYPLQVNFNCSSAIEVTCEDKIVGNFDGAITPPSTDCHPSYVEAALWYKLIGDGSKYFFHNTLGYDRVYVSIYENDYGILSCVNSELIGGHTTYVSFVSEENQPYCIRLGKSFDDNDFDITIECQELAPNDDCVNAINLDSDVNCQLIDYNFISSPSINSYDPDIWFSFSGYPNARILVDSFIRSDAEISLYKESCDSLVPVDFVGSNFSFPNGNAFGLDPDKTYYIRVYQYNSDQQRNVKLCYRGFNAIDNDIIDTAEKLAIDSVCIPQFITTKNATPSLTDGDKDVWFYVPTPPNGNLEFKLTNVDGSELSRQKTSLELYGKENGVARRINYGYQHIKRSMLQVYDTTYIRIRNNENRDVIEDFSICISSFENVPNDNILNASQIIVHDTFVEYPMNIQGLSTSLDNAYSGDYWRYALIPNSGNLDVRLATDHFSNSSYILNLFQIIGDSLVNLDKTKSFLDWNESFSKRVENLNQGDTIYIQYIPHGHTDQNDNPRLAARAYDTLVNETIYEALEITMDSVCTINKSSLYYAEDGDIWYYYIPPENGLVQFDFISFQGNGYGIHNVYAYQKTPDLTLIGSNRDGNNSSLQALFNSGSNSDTVFIQIEETFSSDTYENFEFCLKEVISAENDFCTQAFDLIYDTLPRSFIDYSFDIPTISGIPDDGYECNPYFDNQYDTWYKFCPPKSGDFIIEIASNERFELYKGSCDSLVYLTCDAVLTDENSRRIQADTLNASEVYYLKVLRSSWEGYDSIAIAVYDWVRNPYDELEDAYEFIVSDECQFELFSLDFATRNTDHGSACYIFSYSNFESDIWLKTKTPTTGNLGVIFQELDTINATERLSFELYGKDSLQNLVYIFCGIFNETILYDLEAYDSLFFSFHSINYDKQGIFSLCIYTFEDPINDIAENALFINSSIDCEMDTFTTKYARIEDYNSVDCYFSSYSADGDLWFKVITSKDGTININYDRIDFARFVLEFYQKIDGQLKYLDCYRQLSYHIDIVQNEFTGFPQHDTLYVKFIENDNNHRYGEFGLCFYNNDQSDHIAKKIEGPNVVCIDKAPVEYLITGLENADSIIVEYLDERIAWSARSINSFFLDYDIIDTSLFTLTAYGKYRLGVAYTEPMDIQVVEPQICEIINCSQITDNLNVGESANFGIDASDLFHARHKLSSSALIDSSHYKIFKAGQEVYLKEGLIVEFGSVLDVFIETCPED